MSVLTSAPDTAIDHLRALAAAGADVLDHLELLDSCRFGPAPVIEAAVDDLRGRLAELDRLSPRRTGVPIARLVEQVDPSQAPLAESLAGTVRTTVARIHERSGALSLELRRLLADTQTVVSSATGSAGTYDATGRTAVGPIRRERGLG